MSRVPAWLNLQPRFELDFPCRVLGNALKQIYPRAA